MLDVKQSLVAVQVIQTNFTDIRWTSLMSIEYTRIKRNWASMFSMDATKAEKKSLIKSAQNRKANEANIMTILSKFMGDNRYQIQIT